MQMHPCIQQTRGNIQHYPTLNQLEFHGIPIDWITILMEPATTSKKQIYKQNHPTSAHLHTSYKNIHEDSQRG